MGRGKGRIPLTKEKVVEKCRQEGVAVDPQNIHVVPCFFCGIPLWFIGCRKDGRPVTNVLLPDKARQQDDARLPHVLSIGVRKHVYKAHCLNMHPGLAQSSNAAVRQAYLAIVATKPPAKQVLPAVDPTPVPAPAPTVAAAAAPDAAAAPSGCRAPSAADGVNVTRREGRPSATSSSSDDDDDDEGGDGAIAVTVKTNVKVEAMMEEIREPPEPLKMKKRAKLMKMETEETAGV